MCIICKDFKDGKLTLGEAVRNYGEIKDTLSEEHRKEMEKAFFNNFRFFHEFPHEDGGFGD
mgnify:CR=1 FL=1